MEPEGPDRVAARAGISEPLGFAGLVAVAWRLYRLHLPALLRLFLPALLAVSLLSSAGFEALGGASVREATPAVTAFLFLQVVVGSAVASVLIGLGARLMTRREADAAPLDTARARHLVAAALLVSMVALLTLFLGPALALLVMPLLGPPVVVHAVTLEGKTLERALQRARELLRGSLGRVVLQLLTIALALNLVAATLLSAGAAATGRVLSTTSAGFQVIVRGVLPGVVEALTLPFLAAAMLAIYLDLRARASTGDGEPGGG